MKKIIIFPILVFITLFSFLNSSFPAGTATVNGIDITTIDTDEIQGIKADIFTSYALGTSGTYVYNDVGGTSSTAGSLEVRGYEFKSATFQITNTDSGLCTIRPEYQIGTTSFWFNATTTNISGTGTVYLNITDPVTNLRWGVIKTGTTTGAVTMWADYFRFKRR